MDADRFDRLTRTVARRVSRRTAVASGSLSLGAALLGRLTPATHAQDATPVAGAEIDILFVQSFGSATIVPGDAAGAFTITLDGGTGQTVYFSDRPERLVGTIADEHFLDGRAFDPQDPPNAAIVTLSGEDQDILVVELRDPTLDTSSGAVTYSAQVLEGQPESAALAALTARQQDTTLADTLGPTTLFIDQLSCLGYNVALKPNEDCSVCCTGTCYFDGYVNACT